MAPPLDRLIPLGRYAFMKNLIILCVALFVTSTAQAYTVDSDVPANIKAQISDDLSFMNGITGSGASSIHTQIFGKVDGAAYKNFFESRITAIGLNDCGGGAGVFACVIPFEDSSKMWLAPNYVKISVPQILRAMVIYHEARHTENSNSNWPHANCPTPFIGEDGKEVHSIVTGVDLAGHPACDTTPFGSYGTSLVMLKNIAKFCTNCSDKVKADAALYGEDHLKRIIDTDAKKQIRDDLANAK